MSEAEQEAALWAEWLSERRVDTLVPLIDIMASRGHKHGDELMDLAGNLLAETDMAVTMATVAVIVELMKAE